MDNNDEAGITDDFVTREALYALVWAEPMLKVGERFGVSSSYLARVCTRLNVPRPEPGYWAKLAVGKADPIPALPEPGPGDELAWSRSGQAHSIPRPPPRARRRTDRRPIAVSLPDEHDLIAGSSLHFEAGRVSREVGYLKPYKRSLVDVTATQAMLQRSLAFANQLFLALEAQGNRVMLAPNTEHLQRPKIEYRTNPKAYAGYNETWNPGRPTVVYVGTVAIGVAIVEPCEHVPARYVAGKYIRESDYTPPKKGRHYPPGSTWTTEHSFPSGRLRLQAYSPYYDTQWTKHWDQAIGGELTDQIPAIVREIQKAAIHVEGLAAAAYKKAEAERLRWEEQKREWVREEARQKAAKALKDSKDELLSIIQKWSHAKHIETFFREVESAVTQLPDDQRTRFESRLQLGRKLIGDLNPLEKFVAWKSPEERLLTEESNDDG